MALLLTGQGRILDWELDFLRNTLDAVDASLSRAEAAGGWDEGARDMADYMAGVGSVACQKYIVAIARFLKLSKREALDRGPRVPGGRTVAAVINAAANAWKHEDEWTHPPTRHQQRTLAVLEEVLDDNAWEFTYVNTLNALSGEPRFAGVVASLVEWREELRLRAAQ